MQADRELSPRAAASQAHPQPAAAPPPHPPLPISVPAQQQQQAQAQAQQQQQQQQQQQWGTREAFAQELTACLFSFILPLLPTAEEYAIKEQTRLLLEKLIGRVSPGARLLAFGSMANGFALRNSDMDLQCLLDDSSQQLSPSELVTIIGELIRQETNFQVKPLPKARIPIIKLTLSPTPALPYGIACDIGFGGKLALENTRLLLSYASVDPPRLRTLVLFIKVWSKRRKINSAYRGTLSSYGYTLLVIFFLAHVKQPPILPNLQRIPPLHPLTREETELDGKDIYFFDDINLLRQEWASANRQSVGELLYEFFRFYAKDFNYLHDVISIRTEGGVLSKDAKGWVSDLEVDGGNEFARDRNRLCIEDPFDTHYNVARTVTTDGLYTIRGEFMRASRMLQGIGRPDVAASQVLIELCEEREDALVPAPFPGNRTPRSLLNPAYATNPPAGGPWSPNVGSAADRLSPPRHAFERSIEQVDHGVPTPWEVEAMASRPQPPAHMAPRRQGSRGHRTRSPRMAAGGAGGGGMNGFGVPHSPPKQSPAPLRHSPRLAQAMLPQLSSSSARSEDGAAAAATTAAEHYASTSHPPHTNGRPADLRVRVPTVVTNGAGQQIRITPSAETTPATSPPLASAPTLSVPMFGSFSNNSELDPPSPQLRGRRGSPAPPGGGAGAASPDDEMLGLGLGHPSKPPRAYVFGGADIPPFGSPSDSKPPSPITSASFLYDADSPIRIPPPPHATGRSTQRQQHFRHSPRAEDRRASSSSHRMSSVQFRTAPAPRTATRSRSLPSTPATHHPALDPPGAGSPALSTRSAVPAQTYSRVIPTAAAGRAGGIGSPNFPIPFRPQAFPLYQQTARRAAAAGVGERRELEEREEQELVEGLELVGIGRAPRQEGSVFSLEPSERSLGGSELGDD